MSFLCGVIRIQFSIRDEFVLSSPRLAHRIHPHSMRHVCIAAHNGLISMVILFFDCGIWSHNVIIIIILHWATVNIGMQKLERVQKHFFSFMNPLAYEIWIYIILAYVLVSITLWVVARFSPFEWEITKPPTCDNDLVDECTRRPRRTQMQRCDCMHADGIANETKQSNVNNNSESRCNRTANVNRSKCRSNSCSDSETSTCNDVNSVEGIRLLTYDECDNELNTQSDMESDDDDDDSDLILFERNNYEASHGDDANNKHDYKCIKTHCASTQHNTRYHQHRHDSHVLTRASTPTPTAATTTATADESDTTVCAEEFCEFHGNCREIGIDEWHSCDYVDCDGLQETQLLSSQNDFTLKNSFWFTIGTLMQTSDLNPKVFPFNSISCNFLIYD